MRKKMAWYAGEKDNHSKVFDGNCQDFLFQGRCQRKKMTDVEV